MILVVAEGGLQLLSRVKLICHVLSECFAPTEASSTSLDLLREQHRELHQAVDELLVGIRALTLAPALPPIPESPLQPLSLIVHWGPSV